ncbi:MAG: dihydrodipicolinate synthase family protein [Clostridia bacterium]|nr:dihydrodipicolinate synthase family protein [Clostridia bacterium]
MKKQFALGIYPTMITPYNKDNTVDVGALRALTDWYWEQGCGGIFATCQSSEIHFMNLDERVLLTSVVKEEAEMLAKKDPSRAPMTVVASGHISESFKAQVEELTAVGAAGADALILISNRLDTSITDDSRWCNELDFLISRLDPDLALGIYECPRPYKRLLSEQMLRHCTSTGRFAFIKDTCCDADLIARRIQWIADESVPEGGIRPLLFNANAQTLLRTLRDGAAGYCGVMANFHPDLYVRMYRTFREKPEEAEILHGFLTTAAFLEALAYPCIAKYHLNKIGITMNTFARSCNPVNMTRYHTDCVDSMDAVAEYFRNTPSLKG